MKTFITLSLTLISLYSKAQSTQIPLMDGSYQYQEVVNLDSNIYKKDNLYTNSKLYFVDLYKSAKDVIQYDDKEQGKVIGKGFFNMSANEKYGLFYTGTVTWSVYYTIEIACKKGKYRYKMYDIYINDYETAANNQVNKIENISISSLPSLRKKSWYKKSVDKLSSDISTSFNQSITNLKTYMAKTASDKKDDF